MKRNHFLYLSRQQIESLEVTMQEVIDSLEKMFVEMGNGRVEMPPKPGIHPRPDAFIHAMPAYIPSMNAVGMKWVSGYPENWRLGFNYINGLLILNEANTGIPIAVMDCTWITAVRTGAATALSAKYLARKESSTVGIIACGVQGRSNLEALACIFPLQKVKAYDLVPEVANNFADEMEKRLEIEIEVVDHVKDAVAGLDMVVTSGPILKNPKPTIQPGWLQEGAFASLVDFDSYWTGAAQAEADKIATDDISQMEYYRGAGYFQQTPRAYADLGEIIAGKVPGRESANERILGVNLGIALEDIATASLIYQRAREQHIGTYLPL
ncbi:MAG: ornithine cyclodeaminase family protein [Spirosomataceae bacterium]